MVLSKKTSQEGRKNTFLRCFRFLHRIYFGKLEFTLTSHQFFIFLFVLFVKVNASSSNEKDVLSSQENTS